MFVDRLFAASHLILCKRQNALKSPGAVRTRTRGSPTRTQISPPPAAIAPPFSQSYPPLPLNAVWDDVGATFAFRQVSDRLLCTAAAAGHVRAVATALTLGAPRLDKALQEASAAGRERVVMVLLARGADPNSSEPGGPCALFRAAQK